MSIELPLTEHALMLKLEVKSAVQQSNAMQSNAMQYNTIQYNTIQYNPYSLYNLLMHSYLPLPSLK